MSKTPHGRHRTGALRRTMNAVRRPAVASTLAIAALAASAAGYSAAGSPGVTEQAGAVVNNGNQAAGNAYDEYVSSGQMARDHKRVLAEQRAAAKQAAQRKAAAAKRVSERKAAAKKQAEQARKAAAAKKAAEQAAQERAAAAQKAAEQKAAAEKQAAQARAAAEASASRDQQRTAPTGDPRSIAQAMLGSYGWSGGEFGCLDSLWNKESGWNVNASNASSGAYGIPQALPGGKMASAGADWQTNPATQIRWGLGYIKSVYGTPCAAWAHSQATNWY
jgi:hypothetical protein